MSPKNTLLHASLTALGLFGLAATHAAPGDPPAPTVTAPAGAPATSPSVLLKSNGQVRRGVITEEVDRYVVRVPGGEIRVPKRDAERTFDSIAAAYRYKRENVPEGDPDEHLKLARWCLTQKMMAEAKAE